MSDLPEIKALFVAKTRVATKVHDIAPDLGPMLNHHYEHLNNTKDLGTLTTCDHCGTAYAGDHTCQKQIGERSEEILNGRV